ncbi:MAG TPA: nucleotidyltransferase [Succinivibrionaceae bacterium]|nr:nucleotidyltransferase [Succinivibrionaceae bacterium]
MNTLILMADASDEISSKSNEFPKYLYEISNKPLIQRILESIAEISTNVICVIKKEDQENFFLGDSLKILCPNCSVLELNGDTSGELCSALFAIEQINTNDELLIINGDRFIKQPILPTIDNFRKRNLDCGLITFRSVSPRYSSVLLDKDEKVIEVSDKKPISDHAFAGISYFKKGIDFVDCAFDSIKKDSSLMGKYYIASALNELILKSKAIGVYEILKKDYLILSDLIRINEIIRK